MRSDKNTNKLAEETVRKSRINYGDFVFPENWLKNTFSVEARLVVQYFNILCSVGVNLEDIAIITPYYEQVWNFVSSFQEKNSSAKCLIWENFIG